MCIPLVLAFLLALSPLAVSASSAQTWQKSTSPPKAAPFSHAAELEKVNENVLMIVGGSPGGPWTQIAQDIATVVSEGDDLRVIPIGGGKAIGNVRDVLMLRGVDLGVTRLEALNDAKASGEFGPNLDRRVAYITVLSVDTLQILVRPEIQSVKDLHGKKVNVWPKGSAVTRNLKKLGIEIEEINLTMPEAIEQMRAGNNFGTACMCLAPIPVFRDVSSDLGLKLLEIPYTMALEESYLPASISSDVYPHLIARGSKVPTIGSSHVLISYNWPSGSERYRKIERFVDAFFSKIDILRQAPHHPTWRDVNISASVRGWQRFPAAQQWLDREAARPTAKGPPSGSDVEQARTEAVKAAPNDAAEQERLFREFLEWSRKRPKR
jgi:uncharacterized protein